MTSTILLPHHCRAARALLNLSQEALANAAEVGISSVKRFEAEEVATRPAMLAAIRRALEAKGILFVPDSIYDGHRVEGGVLLKKNASTRK